MQPLPKLSQSLKPAGLGRCIKTLVVTAAQAGIMYGVLDSVRKDLREPKASVRDDRSHLL